VRDGIDERRSIGTQHRRDPERRSKMCTHTFAGNVSEHTNVNAFVFRQVIKSGSDHVTRRPMMECKLPSGGRKLGW
jgi:hypothetical protein